MLNEIKAFQLQAKKLGRDINSVAEFKLWLEANQKTAEPEFGGDEGAGAEEFELGIETEEEHEPHEEKADMHEVAEKLVHDWDKGTLSLKEVFQTIEQKYEEFKEERIEEIIADMIDSKVQELKGEGMGEEEEPAEEAEETPAEEEREGSKKIAEDPGKVEAIFTLEIRDINGYPLQMSYHDYEGMIEKVEGAINKVLGEETTGEHAVVRGHEDSGWQG